MSYTDKIKIYAAKSGEFIEKIYSIEEEQALAKQLGITLDDYPHIPRPVFKKQQNKLLIFISFIYSIFK
ncbi:hypothetical protein UFOVP1367_38 [uncultured Caudovirales phage]|uniref:Uncharacterized protein n=1 Tax=uncultured Caudovirales phage TaxID=2100421 RepID=A0A6J5S530_9CAUD|nr:hypothetical protein KNT69_gp38 [uncultured Caudovirales phage]CAB4202785.1 hypothetical protein UFOVP1367_38 [uncultured Caudovirales phage]